MKRQTVLVMLLSLLVMLVLYPTASMAETIKVNIDLLWKSGEGKVCIWNWKSDKICKDFKNKKTYVNEKQINLKIPNNFIKNEIFQICVNFWEFGSFFNHDGWHTCELGSGKYIKMILDNK